MGRRAIPFIITLALLLPALIAGGWVGYYYSHQPHPALSPTPTPRAHGVPATRTTTPHPSPTASG